MRQQQSATSVARKPFTVPTVREHERLTDLTQIVLVSGQNGAVPG